MTDRILILDFGSQVTQLIARRVRESGVYCEIHPFNMSGGASSPRFAPQGDHPVRRPGLGARRRHAARAAATCSSWACRCSASAMASRRCAAQLGGKVEAGRPPRIRPRLHRDHATIAPCSTASGRRASREQVWMSHGDRVDRAAAGLPRRRASARARRSPSSPTTRAASTACMFHPEVVHTPDGAALLENFTHRRRRADAATGRWRRSAPQEIARIRAPGRQGARDLRPVGRRRFSRSPRC